MALGRPPPQPAFFRTGGTQAALGPYQDDGARNIQALDRPPPQPTFFQYWGGHRPPWDLTRTTAHTTTTRPMGHIFSLLFSMIQVAPA